jgi:hypothetical protein
MSLRARSTSLRAGCAATPIRNSQSAIPNHVIASAARQPQSAMEGPRPESAFSLLRLALEFRVGMAAYWYSRTPAPWPGKSHGDMSGQRKAASDGRIRPIRGQEVGSAANERRRPRGYGKARMGSGRARRTGRGRHSGYRIGQWADRGDFAVVVGRCPLRQCWNHDGRRLLVDSEISSILRYR